MQQQLLFICNLFLYTKILPYENLRKKCYFLDLEKILYENLRKIGHNFFTLRTLRTKKLNPTKFLIFTVRKTRALPISYRNLSQGRAQPEFTWGAVAGPQPGFLDKGGRAGHERSECAQRAAGENFWGFIARKTPRHNLPIAFSFQLCYSTGLNLEVSQQTAFAVQVVEMKL